MDRIRLVMAFCVQGIFVAVGVLSVAAFAIISIANGFDWRALLVMLFVWAVTAGGFMLAGYFRRVIGARMQAGG